MRIVQICPYDISRFGGVQNHILSLTASLRLRGHEVVVVAPGPKNYFEFDGLFYLGTRREIGMSGTRFELTWADGRELRRLHELFQVWKPDVLHFHTLWTPLMPFQVFRRWDGPVVTTFHDTPPPGMAGNFLRHLFKAMSRRILARVDGAIAVSRAPLAHLRAYSHDPLPFILPPAVDLNSLVARKVKSRRSNGVLRFLFVGRLEPRKGITELLQAWELVRQKSQGSAQRLILIIAGKGELSSAVLDSQRRFGSDSLQFVEAPDDATVKQLYADADVFVAPSPFGESFGIVLAEAMASGVPVIAADNPGYASVLVGPGSLGLVRAGDTTELAKKIIHFSEHQDLRETLAAWGSIEAVRYDISTIITRFEAIYGESILHHSRRILQRA